MHRLKKQPNEIFALYFTHQWKPPGPLSNRLIYFRNFEVIEQNWASVSSWKKLPSLLKNWEYALKTDYSRGANLLEFFFLLSSLFRCRRSQCEKSAPKVSSNCFFRLSKSCSHPKIGPRNLLLRSKNVLFLVIRPTKNV